MGKQNTVSHLRPPLEGAPPANATVLFGGESAEHNCNAQCARCYRAQLNPTDHTAPIFLQQQPATAL